MSKNQDPSISKKIKKLSLSQPSMCRTTKAKLFYSSNYFALHTRRRKDKTILTMSLFTTYLNTRDLPHTVSFLKRHFPSVLHTQCFNYNNYPFRKEVRTTEIGHLFEHILLDQLCFIKLSCGSSRAEFSGRTDWDWQKDPSGVFHITININEEDLNIFSNAMEKTIALTEMLLDEPIAQQNIVSNNILEAYKTNVVLGQQSLNTGKF